MNDNEQLRLSPELVAVMRAGVTVALAHGAEFVAPPHLLLGLLADPLVGPAMLRSAPPERSWRAASRSTSNRA